MPWSCDQLPIGSAWRGLANGKTKPLALAVVAFTVTVATASGDGANPLAPRNRIPTTVVRVNRWARVATPALFVRKYSGALHVVADGARSHTFTCCEAIPCTPSFSRCPAIVTAVLTDTVFGALGAMSIVCTTVVAVCDRTAPATSE